MQLDDLKQGLKNREFKGYLFETTPRRIALDTRRRANAMRLRTIQRDILEILAGGLCVALLLPLLATSHSPLARAGAAAMTAAMALNVAAFLALRFRRHRTRFDLPWRRILEEEREKVLARIRLLERFTTRNALPLAAGYAVYAAGLQLSAFEFLLAVVSLAPIGAWLHFRYRRRIRSELKPLLDEIDRELASLDASAA